MTRRRKSSAADDFMDLVALLPWWAGVVLALISYGLLHAVATRPLPIAQSTQQVGQLATTALWQGLATVGQYLLPLLCLLGAITSAVRRQRRRTLLETVSASTAADALQGMSWQQFEMLVGEGFRRRGYAVKEIGGGGADGGVDLMLTREGEKSFVQCKQWKAFKVGVPTVRELYGVMAAHGAAGGFVVTSGLFTQEATAFASGRNIRLIDGSALMELLRSHADKTDKSSQPFNATAPSSAAAPAVAAAALNQMTEPAIAAQPFCPKCGKPMLQRMAKRGAAAGTAFWGCSGFSGGCRGTREIQDA